MVSVFWTLSTVTSQRLAGYSTLSPYVGPMLEINKLQLMVICDLLLGTSRVQIGLIITQNYVLMIIYDDDTMSYLICIAWLLDE